MEGGIHILQSVGSYAKRLTIPLVSIVYTLAIARQLTPNGDTFWALKTGQWVLNHGIPYTDPFSWTARGLPWVAHEWLFDTVLYWLSSRLGFYGLAFTVWLAVAGFFVCLWRLCRAESKPMPATAMVFALAVMLPYSYMVTRPQVYSYLFFTLFLYLLTKNDTRWRWILPPVTLLWANMHGSVILGVAMVVFEALVESVYEKRYSMWPVAGACFLASLINPHGLGLWRFAIWLSNSPLNRHIDEWQPPNFMNFYYLYIYMVVFLAIGCALYVRKRETDQDAATKRRLTSAVLYFLGFSFTAVTGVRYFPYLAVCWAVLFLRLVPDDFMARYNVRMIKTLTVAVMAVILAVGVLRLPPGSIATGVDRNEWPVKAVEYIVAHTALEDHIFNYYTWGGYLIWRGVQPFIDGRADIYEANCTVFKDYIDATDFKVPPVQVLDKYKIRTVLMPKNNPLAVYLAGRPGWKEIYQDNLAVIFERAPVSR